MTSIKEAAIRAIEQLPADAEIEVVMEHLYLLSKVERGLRQIESRRVVPHAEAKQRLGRA